MGMKALGQSVPGAAKPLNVGCLRSPHLAWGALGPEWRSPTLLPPGGCWLLLLGDLRLCSVGRGGPASPTHHGTWGGRGGADTFLRGTSFFKSVCSPIMAS